MGMSEVLVKENSVPDTSGQGKRKKRKMKRLISICLMVVVVTLGAVAIPHQAGATTTPTDAQALSGASVTTNVIPAQGDTSWTQAQPGFKNNPHKLAIEAEKALAALEAQQASTGGTGPHTNVSVSVGLFTYLLTLSHADLKSILLTAWVHGYVGAMTALCATLGGVLGGPLGALFLGASCAVALEVEAASIVAAMGAAYNTPTWLVAWWCGAAGHFNWTACPGGTLNAFGYWIYPTYVTGFNILFNWTGIVIAWQPNSVSG